MGWNGSDRNSHFTREHENPQPKRSLRPVILITFGTSLILASLLFLFRSLGVNEDLSDTGSIASDSCHSNGVALQQTQTDKSSETIDNQAAGEDQNGLRETIPTPNVVTTEVHNVQSEVILPDGTKQIRPKPIFKKRVERILSKGLMPVLPPGHSPGAVSFANRFTDEQLLSMMMEKVEILPTDSEHDVMVKLDMQELKNQVLAHVKNGGNIRDVFEEIDDRACGAAKERHLTSVGLREVRKIGDPELTTHWINRRNEKLRELGLPEIDLQKELNKMEHGK